MVTLVILDGFGLSKEKYGNAITSAGTPNHNIPSLLLKQAENLLDCQKDKWETVRSVT